MEGREARLCHGIYMTLNLLYGYFSRPVSQQALGFLIISIPLPPVSLSRPHPETRSPSGHTQQCSGISFVRVLGNLWGAMDRRTLPTELLISLILVIQDPGLIQVDSDLGSVQTYFLETWGFS